jgi:hypothetical protein
MISPESSRFFSKGGSGIMARISALGKFLVLTGLATIAGFHAAAASEFRRLEPAQTGTPARQIPAAAQIPMTPRGAGLSDAVARVSHIAGQNGERFFLVVDKVNGKIAVFENAIPIFVAAALTGESTADFMPADAIHKTYAQQVGVKYKVTPAGRFTLSRGFDPKYGELLDFNEVQGSDWALAIHRVALGNKAQRRADRLRSANGEDTHITDGCIDVDPTTVQHLLRLLARAASVPIYVLPMDDSLFTKLFPSRVTASNKVAQPG